MTLMEGFRFIRKVTDTEPFKSLVEKELLPGREQVHSDSDEEVEVDLLAPMRQNSPAPTELVVSPIASQKRDFDEVEVGDDGEQDEETCEPNASKV